jgi:hypothetical protein
MPGLPLATVLATAALRTADAVRGDRRTGSIVKANPGA